MKLLQNAQLIAKFQVAAQLITHTTGFKPNKDGIRAVEAFFRQEHSSVAALEEQKRKELVLSLGAFIAEALIAEYETDWIEHEGQYGVLLNEQMAFPFAKARKFLQNLEGGESLSSLFDSPNTAAQNPTT